MKRLFDSYDESARKRGTAVIPAAGFYFAISDSLVSLASPNVEARRVTIAYAIENWRMTRASRQTALSLAGGPRLAYLGGRLREVAPQVQTSNFSFPPPLGEQAVLAYHGGEVLTVPRSTRVEEVRVVMTAATFSETTFDSDEIGAAERAQSRFTIVAQVETNQGQQIATARGHDISTGSVPAAPSKWRSV
jgi:hypothetical protein